MRIWYELSAATKLKTAHALNKDSENNRTVERTSIGDVDLKFKTKKTLPRQGFNKSSTVPCRASFL